MLTQQRIKPSNSRRISASSSTILIILTLASLILVISARSRGLPSICMLPPPRSEGICTIEIEGFYFDKRTNDCEMYVVGGCRSSPGQSFGSRQDCLATCVHGTRHIQDLHENE